MYKINKIGYQNRFGRYRDLPTATKLILANHYLKNASGFAIGEKVKVEYLPNQIIISKINQQKTL